MHNQRVTASLDNQSDESLIDTLIAISVVAKRLAEKLRQEKDKDSYKENLDKKKLLTQLLLERSE